MGCGHRWKFLNGACSETGKMVRKTFSKLSCQICLLVNLCTEVEMVFFSVNLGESSPSDCASQALKITSWVLVMLFVVVWLSQNWSGRYVFKHG